MLGVAWAAWATHGPGGHPVGRGNRSSLAPDARAPCTAHRGPAHFAHSAEEGSSSRALLSAHLIPNQTLASTAACSGTTVEGLPPFCVASLFRIDDEGSNGSHLRLRTSR